MSIFGLRGCSWHWEGGQVMESGRSYVFLWLMLKQLDFLCGQWNSGSPRFIAVLLTSPFLQSCLSCILSIPKDQKQNKIFKCFDQFYHKQLWACSFSQSVPVFPLTFISFVLLKQLCSCFSPRREKTERLPLLCQTWVLWPGCDVSVPVECTDCLQSAV